MQITSKNKNQQQTQHLNPARLKVPYPLCKRGFCKYIARMSKSVASQSHSAAPKHLNMINISGKPHSVKSSRGEFYDRILETEYQSKPKVIPKHTKNSKSAFDLPECSNDKFLQKCFIEISQQRDNLISQIQEKDKELLLLKRHFDNIAKEAPKSRKNYISHCITQRNNFLSGIDLQISQNRDQIIRQQSKQQAQEQPISSLLKLKQRLNKINIIKVLKTKKKDRQSV